MPELAAMYGLGFVCCLALTMLYVFLRDRRRKSHGAQLVQTNLKKIGLFWSDHRDSVVPLSPDVNQAEARKSQLAIGYTGLILSLLSWAGVFFLLIIMLSERFLARSRRERRLFGSELSKNANLTADQVRRDLDVLDIQNDNPSEVASPI